VKAEVLALFGWNGELSPAQTLRLDCAVAARLALDDLQGQIMRGEPVDPAKMIPLSETLSRLLPPTALAAPPPEVGHIDPRETMLRDEEITQLAFAAHTGDKAARQKLDKLNAEKALNDSEHRSIDAAISDATVRVQKAQEAESQALAGEAARELLKKADALLVHAQSLDDANMVRVEASRAITEELNQMRELARGLGVFVPSHEQFLSLGSRAEMTATMLTPFAREALAETGVDPALINPLHILAAIAADADAPAGARVAACRVLLGVKDQDSAEDSAAAGDVAERAIRLLTARKAAH
jgi:hypothetical protein